MKLKYSQTPIIIKITNMKHDNTCQSWPLAVLNFGDIKEDYIIMRKKSPFTFTKGSSGSQKVDDIMKMFYKAK